MAYGSPAARIEVDGEVKAAVVLVVEAGRVSRLHGVFNPHKLTRLTTNAEFTR